MTTLKQNLLTNQPDGLAVSVANSANSGDAFYQATPGTGSLTYSDDLIKSGVFPYKTIKAVAGAASNCLVNMQATAATTHTTSTAYCAYFYFPASLATTATQMMRNTVQGGNGFYNSQSAAAPWTCQDQTSSRYTYTASTLIGQLMFWDTWVTVGPSTSSSVANGRLYSVSPRGVHTLLHEYNGTGLNFGNTAAAYPNFISWGKISNSGNNAPFYMGGFRTADQAAYMGPLPWTKPLRGWGMAA